MNYPSFTPPANLLAELWPQTSAGRVSGGSQAASAGPGIAPQVYGLCPVIYGETIDKHSSYKTHHHIQKTPGIERRYGPRHPQAGSVGVSDAMHGPRKREINSIWRTLLYMIICICGFNGTKN